MVLKAVAKAVASAAAGAAAAKAASSKKKSSSSSSGSSKSSGSSGGSSSGAKYTIGGQEYTKDQFERMQDAILRPTDTNRLHKASHTNTDGTYDPFPDRTYLTSNGATMFDFTHPSSDHDQRFHGTPGSNTWFGAQGQHYDYKNPLLSGMSDYDRGRYIGNKYLAENNLGDVAALSAQNRDIRNFYGIPDASYADMTGLYPQVQNFPEMRVAGVYDEAPQQNWLPIPQQMPQQQPQQLQANMLPSAMIPFAIPDFEYDIPMPEEYKKGGTIYTPTLAAVQAWQQGKQQAHDEYRARYQDEWSRYMNMLDEAYRQKSMTLDESYRRDSMNLAQQNQYYGQQGLVGPAYANDPTPQIQELQRIATEASKIGDMDRSNWAHNEAERLRIAAGWGSGGADGSLTQHLMSLAGTPTWERQVYESPEQQAMRELAVQEAQAKVAATQALQTQRLASVSKSSSGGSSTKPKEPTQKDWEGAITSTSSYYKTGADYLADLKRNKSAIVKVAGADGYRRLEKEAEGMKYDKGSDFKSGSASPLRTALRNAGVI